MAEILEALVPLLGQALLHFLWQGALIGGVAALLLGALREARPQARYAVACLALLACVLAPIATMLAPLLTSGFAPMLADMSSAPVVPGTSMAPTLLATIVPGARLDPWMPAIVATWAAGTFMLSLRLAVGLAWVRRARRTPQGPAQAAWQRRLDALAAHFQLPRAVELRLVDNLESPVAAGWWRPVVLLPAGLLARMPTDLIEALLAHELAHIRRHDYLVNLLQNAVEAVLFYHPAVWWLSHRIRVEREQIADQLASEVACSPRRLALALSELSELQRTPPALHLVQAAHGGQLMSRIEQLIRPVRRAHPGARIVFPLLGLLALGLATFSYARIGDGHDATTVVTMSSGDDDTVVTSGGSLTVVDDPRRDGYALVDKQGDQINLHGDIDMSAITLVKRQRDGEFLWFRRDGRNYLVTDPAVLAKAREAWRETNAIGAKMEPLGEEMEKHGEKMERLGEQMEALSQGHRPSAAMRAAERRIDELAEQQQELADDQSDLASQIDDAGDAAERDQLARRVDALSVQMDAISRQMDEQSRVLDAEARRLEEAVKPMDALSRQMDEASKPMDALGRQMDALGKQMEVASKKAEREMRVLIDEAMARKLAMPVGAR
jgi:beta-lactamase regulating signal transducer with metallopeptidase domain